MISSCIYNGNVIHKRFKPKEHFFKYKVFSLFIDLSELNELNKIQNQKDLLFCGSYFGYGFHEDGIKSSLEMLKNLDD